MENKNKKYRVVEEDRLTELLEIEQLADEFGFACYREEYENFQDNALPELIKEELNKYKYLPHVLEEYLNAENIVDVSDEEKEDSLYIDEFDSCDCCSNDYDEDGDYEDEVEATYTIVYLGDDEDTDTDSDSEVAFHLEYDTYWADEFDDFYSESFENSIFKEMEDFVNGKYPTSMEQEQEQKNMPDNVIIGPELYQILEDYFKKMFE